MIYISGWVDVDSENIEEYAEAFDEAEKYLKNDVQVYSDTTIINSYRYFEALYKQGKIKDRTEEIVERIKLISQCDKIYMLQGWEHDQTARAEYEASRAMGKRYIYSRKF